MWDAGEREKEWERGREEGGKRGRGEEVVRINNVLTAEEQDPFVNFKHRISLERSCDSQPSYGTSPM